MGFENIDAILDNWAKVNGLQISKQYQETDVRSVEQRAGRRSGYQIWIDEPDTNGLIGIHVWDFKRHGERRDFLVPIVDLREYLDSALKIANNWLDK